MNSIIFEVSQETKHGMEVADSLKKEFDKYYDNEKQKYNDEQNKEFIQIRDLET